MGGIIGGVFGAISANSAAKKQAAAAERDLNYQRETRDLVFDRYEPFYGSGVNALNALNFELGLGDRPTVGGTPRPIRTFTTTTPGTAPGASLDMFGPNAGRAGDRDYSVGAMGTQPTSTTGYRVGNNTFATMEEAQAYANANRTGGTPYAGFQTTPGFQFQLEQGQDAVNALAGARGGLNSGATLQALSQFNQGLASQEYNNYLNRLFGMVGTGSGAAGGQAAAAQNSASGVSNALAGIGNAQSAGAIGVGNAISGGINNQIGMWQYQRAQQPQQQSGGIFGGLFGGGGGSSLTPRANPFY